MAAAPPHVASFDSATGMLGATAAFLHGKASSGLGRPAGLGPFADVTRFLPRLMRQRLFAASGALEAIDPERAAEVDAEAVARWMAGRYPRRRYPAVAIGSANGALVHLCAALGIPWLPQTFLVPVRQRGVEPDEAERAAELGQEAGERLLRANPDLQLHRMHDAGQDRMMIRHMAYFRVKRLTLGAAYTAFLTKNLAAGGTIIAVDCAKTTPTTRMGERHVFQHAAADLQADGPAPDGVSPEAEWGFEPSLLDDLVAFSHRRGHGVVRLRFNEPEDLSPLVADLYAWWYRRRMIVSRRLLGTSFTVTDPLWTFRVGAVPFWLENLTDASALALERHLDKRPPFDYITLCLFQPGTEDLSHLAPLERWQAILARARRRGEFAGHAAGGYPADFSSFARYQNAIKRISVRYPLPHPLPMEDFGAFLRYAGRYKVTVQPVEGAITWLG